MLRKIVLGLAILASGVAVSIAWQDDATSAQPDSGHARAQRSDPLPPAQENERSLKPAQTLPVKQVILFNSGVGYFQRSGEIDGDARIDLQFPASDINDLIKSFVIEDAKGRVMPLHYDSQEPIEKTLKSFAIDLSSNPSFGQILNQARGEKIELTLLANNTGLPGTLTGVIVGMESAHRLPSTTSTATAEMEFVNLLCAEGLRSIPLTQVQRLRFLNANLETELRRALEVVAVGHDSQKKAVRVQFKGEGKREVKVGYVVENPIWKTSYRLVMGKDGKPRLLGWANIENTSDEDWQNVKLTLVSSRPISFQMDLYPPLFIPRPLIEPALFASLRPPTYAGPLSTTNANLGIGGFQGFGGAFAGANNTFKPGNLPQMQQGQQIMQNPGMGQFGNLGGQFGGQAGPTGNVNRYQRDNNLNSGNNKLTFQELQQRRMDQTKTKYNEQKQQQAKDLGSMLTNVDPELIEAALTAEELGNPARFVIDEPVNLPRQQSAMIPLFDVPIEATRVSIYNQSVQPMHPLHGMKFKNNTKQSLMQGPISVFEQGHYAGDARVLDLQPGEERFISYAIDKAVEIKPFDKVIPSPEMTVKMENNLLKVQYKLRQTRTYLIKNRSPEARKIVLEQPVRDGWNLAEARKLTVIKEKNGDATDKEAWKPGDNQKPMERTRDLYRFAVDVNPGELVRYEVSEELPRIDPFESTKQADWSGFATSLGLDVWTEIKRTPEGNFGVQLVGDKLYVTHKDRRTTTYFIRNRAGIDRTVWLEHVVGKERKLVGDAKPEPANSQRYRFKLELGKDATLQLSVIEELKEARPESFTLMTVDGTPLPRPGTSDLPQQRYVTELGFEVWTTTKTHDEVLKHASLVKKNIETTSSQQETITYFIRNRSEQPRTFELDHVVRPSWTFVGEIKPLEAAGVRYRFRLQGNKDQVVKQEVTEEKSQTRKESLESLTSDRVKRLTASATLSNAFKTNLQKAFTLRSSLEQVQATLKDLRDQVKEITDEQTRLRGNMEKLPQDSPLYKRLIEKFDKEESALEKVRKQISEKIAEEKLQKTAYDDFIETLKVD